MKNIHNYFGFFLILTTLGGCEEFLEVDHPKDQIVQEIVFNDDKTADAAIGHLYVQLFNSGFFSGNVLGNSYLMACYSDELEVTTAQSTDFRLFYDGAVNPSNDAVKMLWNQSYQQIYVCNNMLQGLSTATGLSTETKNQLKGEVLAIRALLHFYLSQTFGSVPYVTVTDYNINRKISKQSVSNILNLVIADLLEAEKNLSVTYPTSEKIRINQTVAKALLARVFLYQENWIMAREYAETVIQSDIYALETPSKVFLKQSKSAIWQLKPTLPGLNTYEAYSHFFFTVPPPQARISAKLLNSFEIGDQRMQNWIKFVGTGNSNAHAYKYKQFGTTTVPVEYPVVLRIEEMYLISAEAAAELEDWSVFNLRITALRDRAGLQAKLISEKEAAYALLIQERKIEFFCEYGHRFYDLKRYGKLNGTVLDKPGWKNYFAFLPIPENELVLNPNLLPQNEGY